MNKNEIRAILFENPFSKIITRIFSGILIMLIKLYQYSISPLLPNSCRFIPTCSQYSIKAIKDHGVFKGLALGIYRIVRCNPWGGHGFDPVPEKGAPFQTLKSKKKHIHTHTTNCNQNL